MFLLLLSSHSFKNIIHSERAGNSRQCLMSQFSLLDAQYCTVLKPYINRTCRLLHSSKGRKDPPNSPLMGGKEAECSGVSEKDVREGECTQASREGGVSGGGVGLRQWPPPPLLFHHQLRFSSICSALRSGRDATSAALLRSSLPCSVSLGAEP